MNHFNYLQRQGDYTEITIFSLQISYVLVFFLYDYQYKDKFIDGLLSTDNARQ